MYVTSKLHRRRFPVPDDAGELPAQTVARALGQPGRQHADAVAAGNGVGQHLQRVDTQPRLRLQPVQIAAGRVPQDDLPRLP